MNLNFKLFDRRANLSLVFLINLMFALLLLILFKSVEQYKLEGTLGEYSFYSYNPISYFPRVPIAILLLLLVRWIALELMIKKEVVSNGGYVIQGENRLDILKVCSSNLICVVASDNYVEIYYLNGIKVEKKIMRSSLKKIQKQIPELVKTHRSYLISPVHFIKWENANNIALSHMNVPVSRNYKATVKSRVASYH